MPDGGATPDFTYRRAIRGRFAPLLMISGPSGVGKTYSALRLATGLANGGKICFADTDNSRAKLYAGEFQFDHLDLHEPFRPMLFERAAIAAQNQNAAVLIIDNFAAEWVGPGGILEWHEQELERMAGDNLQRREQLKMVCWGKVKPPHKHMFQRLYQLNMPIILCCAAEKKIAMVKQTEGKDKGKVVPIDQGFQPIGDKDAAYAMTLSLMLEDVSRPGVPRPVKALLPDLKSIIHLDRPLDEETGSRLAAWAHGAKIPATEPRGEQSEAGSREETSSPPEHGTTESAESDSRKDTVTPPPPDDPEERIRDGAKKLAARFAAVKTRKEHLDIVDEVEARKQTEYLRRRRKQVYDEILAPAMKASWSRTEPPRDDQPSKQGDLMDDQTDRAEGDPRG